MTEPKKPNKKKIIRNIITISCCYECPFSTWEINAYYCSKDKAPTKQFGEVIQDPWYIPDWCPLEDFKALVKNDEIKLEEQIISLQTQLASARKYIDYVSRGKGCEGFSLDDNGKITNDPRNP